MIKSQKKGLCQPIMCQAHTSASLAVPTRAKRCSSPQTSNVPYLAAPANQLPELSTRRNPPPSACMQPFATSTPINNDAHHEDL